MGHQSQWHRLGGREQVLKVKTRTATKQGIWNCISDVDQVFKLNTGSVEGIGRAVGKKVRKLRELKLSCTPGSRRQSVVRKASDSRKMTAHALGRRR